MRRAAEREPPQGRRRRCARHPAQQKNEQRDDGSKHARLVRDHACQRCIDHAHAVNQQQQEQVDPRTERCTVRSDRPVCRTSASRQDDRSSGRRKAACKGDGAQCPVLCGRPRTEKNLIDRPGGLCDDLQQGIVHLTFSFPPRQLPTRARLRIRPRETTALAVRNATPYPVAVDLCADDCPAYRQDCQGDDEEQTGIANGSKRHRRPVRQSSSDASRIDRPRL